MCVCVCVCSRETSPVGFLRAESREGGREVGAPGRTINNDCGRRGGGGEREGGKAPKAEKSRFHLFSLGLLF